jgi:hypothetical protein
MLTSLYPSFSSCQEKTPAAGRGFFSGIVFSGEKVVSQKNVLLPSHPSLPSGTFRVSTVTVMQPGWLLSSYQGVPSFRFILRANMKASNTLTLPLPS